MRNDKNKYVIAGDHVQNIELIDNFDILNKKTSISVDEKVV